FLFAFAVLKLNAARAREVLPEKMRSACLDRLAVLHDRFNRHRLHRAWKFFALRFFPRKNGNGAMIARKRFVNTEHTLRLLARFRFGLVNSVPLLPEKFGRAEKKSRPHFPPHDIRPLIKKDRKVPIGLDPLCVARADDGFACWPDD